MSSFEFAFFAILGTFTIFFPISLGQSSLAEIQPKAYQLPLPPALEGPLAVNNLLQNLTKLLENQINAPESLLVENGNTIYTGTGDGKVVKIVDGVIQKELRLVSPPNHDCNANYDASLCGRPVGIRRVPNTSLIAIADFSLGIFTVDFDSDNATVTQVYSSQTPIDGRRPLFLNDIDVVNETLAFVSDSSDRWINFGPNYIFMEMPDDGRLFQVDLTDGSTIRTVVDGLNFANGVQLHPDGQSVLVADGAMCRIKRHYFDGPKAGTTETFVENLPGTLDNIRLGASGETLLVALGNIRNATDFMPPLDLLGPHPSLRAYLAQALPFESIQAMYSRLPDMIVELDSFDGGLIRSYQDGGTNNAQSPLIFVSQASDNGTHLLLGSFASQFIGVVPKVESCKIHNVTVGLPGTGQPKVEESHSNVLVQGDNGDEEIAAKMQIYLEEKFAEFTEPGEDLPKMSTKQAEAIFREAYKKFGKEPPKGIHMSTSDE